MGDAAWPLPAPRPDPASLTDRQAYMEGRRQAALARLHAAAAEAEVRIATGPNRSAAPRPAAPAAATASAMERLRMAMAEAEAKLLANGKGVRSSGAAAAPAKRAAPERSRSPRRAAPLAPATPGGSPPADDEAAPEDGAAAEEGEATPAPAVPAAALGALEQLRRALADADARISDPQGKHWLGAHEPAWQPGPRWSPGDPLPRPDGPKARSPWPLVEKLRVASVAADGEVSASIGAAVANLGVAGKYAGDVHARFLGRFGTPPAVRPQLWAHGTDLALPEDASGRRHLAKRKVPLPRPPPPPQPRAQSAGRISLSFSSPARNEYTVALSFGASVAPAGGAMTDAPITVGTGGVLSKTWTHVPQVLPQCVRETPAAQAAPVDLLADVALPWCAERGHDPRAPRHAARGKAEARATPSGEPAAAKEPYAPPAMRPRRETELAPEAEEAPSTSARLKPQRGPHIVRRKARKLPPMRAALPPHGVEVPPPPVVPDAATAEVKPRALLREPTRAELGEDALAVDGPFLRAVESPGAPPTPLPPAPHALPAPTAPPTPLLQQPAPPAPRRAQPEAAFAPRELAAPGRGAAKRWRARRRTERQVVTEKRIRRGKVTLTRWQAACIIQAHFRGMEARRLMSAVKARILLSTHLSEKALLGKSMGLEEGAIAPAALRHVKVLAEFYEKSSSGRRFADAATSAVTSATSRVAPGAAAALPARPNPLLRIYEQQGEAAALEAAAREALTWTNWMVPDLAKEAEDDATLAAVRAFRDMLKEGETPTDSRQFADRIALKAAAEVIAPAMAELAAHGLAADHYTSATTTIANRLRDGKDALGDAAAPRKVPTVAHSAAVTKQFETHFAKLKSGGSQPRAARAPEPAQLPAPAPVKAPRATATASLPTAKVQVPKQPAAKASPMPAAKAAAAPKAVSPPVTASTPLAQPLPAGKAPAGKARGERSWFDSAASLFGGRGGGLSQQAAATRIQAAVRGLRARRQLDILKARVELRAAVAAVRDKGIAAQPAVLDRTMALGDAYLRAWNLPRAEQCYTHVLETMERDYGRGDVRCVRPASALARVFRERGEPGRAEEVMRRATAAASPKPGAPAASPPRDPLSAALGGLFGGVAAPAAAVPSTGSKVLDSAAVGVQDALASSGKALQGAADNLAGALGLGWLSSQTAKTTTTA